MITSVRWTSGARICEPTSVCCLTCSYSSSRQRPLLVEDLLADADLADVVQPARGADRLHLLVGAAELCRHHGREIGHPGGVAAEVGVLGLERVDQRLERGDRDPLLGGLLDPPLGRPQRDFLLEPLVDLLAFEQAVPALRARAGWRGQMGRGRSA